MNASAGLGRCPGHSHITSFGCLTYSSAMAKVAITLVTLTAHTLICVSQSQTQCIQKGLHNETYAAPNPSMPITASFFLKGSCTLRTIGTGSNNIAQSAMTSVKSNARNMGTVCTHELP